MADEEVENTSEASEEDEAASGGRGKLILIAVAAVLVLAGAGAGFVLLGSTGSSDAEEAIESADGEASAEDEADHPFERQKPKDAHEVAAGKHESKATATGKLMMGEIFSLDTFIVNIGDGDRDRYLKLKADLELSEVVVSDEIQQRLPQMRDLIISLLGSKAFDDVRSIEGKDLLREEMLQRINAHLTTGTARSIFFTEFVVQ